MLKRRGVVIDPEELDTQWVNRILDGGINVVGLHPNPKEGSAIHAVEKFLHGESVKLLNDLEKHGVYVEWEMHALSCLLPRELFGTHPAWFRMNRAGERTPDFNLCSSSDEALERISANAADLAKRIRPRSHRYYFWLDDVAQTACCCALCREFSQADQALKVYNAILRGIRRADPEAMQCYLAYHDTNAVPRKVKPDRGIFLEYAPFNRDFEKCIADPASEKNLAESRDLAALLELFGKENAQVLDYWLDNSLFSGWKKPPKEFHMHTDVLKEDVKFYKEMGFESITSFACYLGKEYTQLYPEPEDPVIYGRVLSSTN